MQFPIAYHVLKVTSAFVIGGDQAAVLKRLVNVGDGVIICF